jgi:CMP-N-acetylneuraminic acid synthetase
VQWRRPDLAADGSPTIDLIDHVFSSYPAHRHIVLLQPTSPDRPEDLLEQALAVARSGDGSVVAVTGNPARNSGAFYVYDREVMPDAAWSTLTARHVEADASDIDTSEDFATAERLMSMRLS